MNINIIMCHEQAFDNHVHWQTTYLVCECLKLAQGMWFLIWSYAGKIIALRLLTLLLSVPEFSSLYRTRS